MIEHDSHEYLKDVQERWAYNMEVREFIGKEEYDRIVNIDQTSKNLNKVIKLLTWEEYEQYKKQPWANDLENFLNE